MEIKYCLSSSNPPYDTPAVCGMGVGSLQISFLLCQLDPWPILSTGGAGGEGLTPSCLTLAAVCHPAWLHPSNGCSSCGSSRIWVAVFQHSQFQLHYVYLRHMGTSPPAQRHQRWPERPFQRSPSVISMRLLHFNTSKLFLCSLSQRCDGCFLTLLPLSYLRVLFLLFVI